MKLRVLLTTGSGLYGIGLYGTGQDAEIRLEQSHAVMGDAPAVDPDSGSRQSGAQKLTMTFVNSNALQNGESPRGRSPLYESGNERHHHSYDRPAYDTRHGDGATSRAAALHSTPKPLGSRKTLGYANSSTEATARMQNFSSTDDRPRGSTYATQRLPEANMQWDGGSRVEQGRSRSSGRRRSRSFGRRRSRSVGRRRSRSFDRRRSRSFGRRPSRSFDHRRSRSLSRNRRHATASRGAAGDGWAGRAESGGGRDAPPRQGYRRSRSPSGHKRISHPARRDSPRRRSSPQRRRGRSPSPRSSRGLPRSSLNRKRSRSGSRRRNSSPPKIHGSLRRRGSPPRHSPRRSTELSRAHRSRGDSKDRASATRGRNSSNRRDGRSSSPAAKARKPARERSVEAAEDGETTMRRGNGDHHEGHRVQQQGFDRVPPRDYKATPPAAVYAKPVGYGAKPMQSAPKEATRAPDNGRGAVVGATAGARTVDPIIPLALGGAPVPPVAAVPGKRFLIEGVVGGGGGFPASDDPATKLYHTASGNGDKAYPAGNGRMPRVGWPHRDVAGNQGGGGGGPLAPHLAPAVLPPMSSLRPMPLPAGCAQGARLMIKGTHPAVPERRIHALVSAFGIVGKIEVLEVSLGCRFKRVWPVCFSVRVVSCSLLFCRFALRSWGPISGLLVCSLTMAEGVPRGNFARTDLWCIVSSVYCQTIFMCVRCAFPSILRETHHFLSRISAFAEIYVPSHVPSPPARAGFRVRSHEVDRRGLTCCDWAERQDGAARLSTSKHPLWSPPRSFGGGNLARGALLGFDVEGKHARLRRQHAQSLYMVREADKIGLHRPQRGTHALPLLCSRPGLHIREQLWFQSPTRTSAVPKSPREHSWQFRRARFWPTAVEASAAAS